MTQRPWLDEFAESRGAMARASLQEASLKRDGEQPVGRGTGEMTNQIDTRRSLWDRIVRGLLDPHSWCGAVVWREQVDAGPVARRRKHHPLGNAKAHLARRKIGNHRRQPAHEIGGRVS